jgi:hypothetical protein
MDELIGRLVADGTDRVPAATAGEVVGAILGLSQFV